VFDPFLDVAPPVADMPAYSEAWWSFFSIPPLVEGGDGHIEIVGELLHGDEPVLAFHALDDGWTPSQMTLICPRRPSPAVVRRQLSSPTASIDLRSARTASGLLREVCEGFCESFARVLRVGCECVVVLAPGASSI
jgi:hypothetical protein